MTHQANVLLCSACGREVLLLRKPVYEGFKKIGELLTCSACGYVYRDEASVPFKEKQEQAVFSEADRPRPVHVFNEGENRTLCRYCAHYVVNPFVQWCGLHKKEVASTDTCDQWRIKAEHPSAE